MRRFDPQTALNLVDRGERGVVVRVCVAVCYRVLQCIAVCCSVVNGDLVDRGELGFEMRVCFSALQCVTVCDSVLYKKLTHSPKTVCTNGCLMNDQCSSCMISTSSVAREISNPTSAPESPQVATPASTPTPPVPICASWTAFTACWTFF